MGAAPAGWPGAAPPPAKSGSRAVWMVPLVLVGLLVLLGGGSMATIAVRRYQTLADAHECETSKSRGAEACDHGDMRSCARLGVLYETGAGGMARSTSRAAELYQKECDGEDLPA